MTTVRTLICVCMLLLAKAVVAGPVLVSSNFVESNVINNTVFDLDNTTETVPPVAVNLSATIDGLNSSANFAYASLGTTDLFSVAGMAHSIDASSEDGGLVAQTFVQFLKFTVDQAATYSMAGLYKFAAEGTDEVRVLVDNYLLDRTTGDYLFRNNSQALGTEVSGVFDLRTPGQGNIGGIDIGSFVGDLISGHEYWWYSGHGINTTDPKTPETVKAVGGGFSSLKVSSVAVPEPSSLGLLGAGLLGLGFMRRKQAA